MFSPSLPILARPNALRRIYASVKAAVARRPVAVLSTWGQGQYRADYWDRTFPNYVAEGYKRNEIIYACITTTASTAASVALLAHDKATDEPQPEHPIQALIARPNPMMSEFDFWSWTFCYQMLAGVAYWQKIRDGRGNVLELWPVRPDYVNPVYPPGAKDVIYKIKIEGVEQDDIPAADMVVFKLMDPMNYLRGQSPLEIIARTTDVDNSLTDLLKLFMQKGAMPLGVLTSKLQLTDDAVTDIQRRWGDRYGGYANWTIPAVLDNDATYQRVGMTLNEMEFAGLDARAETRICMVYRIPPILVGSTYGLSRGTFSNYAEARRQWWEDSLSAQYKQFVDVMQQQLAPDFGEDIVLKWDFSKVPALQEERTARWTRATAALTSGAITVNDAREEMGLPKVGKEGDVFLRPAMSVAVPNNPVDDAPTAEGDDSDIEQTDDEPPTPDETATNAETTEGKAAKILGAPLTPAETKDSYVLLSLENDPSIIAIQNKLKAINPGYQWSDPGDFHITLVYATGPQDLQLIRNSLPKSINDLSFEIGALGTFDKPGDLPIYLGVQSTPELLALQSGLAGSFKSLGLSLSPFSDPASWKPHITLGYMPAGSALPVYDASPVTLGAHSLKFSVEVGDSFDVMYVTKSAIKPVTADTPVRESDVARWERMYQAIAAEVHRG